VWDCAGHRHLRSLARHSGSLMDLAADGDLVASTCGKELRLWSAASGECLLVRPHNSPIDLAGAPGALRPPPPFPPPAAPAGVLPAALLPAASPGARVGRLAPSLTDRAAAAANLPLQTSQRWAAPRLPSLRPTSWRWS
jgi:hypothetical protein